ncbi:MAG TPA: hypothetical protein DCM38_02170 [Gammaproteobacteria bacterium]|nr:hypothetical protein [Gammaproteobacteria bacterium]
MKFSTREIYFLIEACEYRIQSYEKALESNELDDDEYSDIINDKGVLEILLSSLKKALPNKQTVETISGIMICLQDTTEYLLSTIANRKQLNAALDGLKKREIYIYINQTEL